MGSKNETVGKTYQIKTFQRYCVCLMNQWVLTALTALLFIYRKKESRTICTVFKNYLYYIINIYFSMSEWVIHWIIWCLSPCFSFRVHEKIYFVRSEVFTALCIQLLVFWLWYHATLSWKMQAAACSTSMLVFINKTTHQKTAIWTVLLTADIVCHFSGSSIYIEWSVKAGQGGQDPEDTSRKKKCNQHINALS